VSRLMRAISVAVWFAVCGTVAATADAQAAAGAPDVHGTESLGARLMDGLPVGADLPAADATAPAPPADGRGILPRTDREDQGEDIGGPSGPLPLVRAQYGMRTAQALLAAPQNQDDVDRAGRAQDEVVSELDALIAELSRQCRSCAACQNSGEKPGECRRSPGAATGKVKPGHGSAPARDSNDRLDRASAQSVDAADVQPLLKRLWGHLPERVREQMLQSYSDSFLPQYELELEKYYRRLAEEPADSGSD
jgi:hypothetical protein